MSKRGVLGERRVCQRESCLAVFTFVKLGMLKYCSSACRTAAGYAAANERERQERAVRAAARDADRRCVDCAAGLQGRSPCAKRCENCRDVHDREYKREQIAARRARDAGDVGRAEYARRALAKRKERAEHAAPTPWGRKGPATQSTQCRSAKDGAKPVARAAKLTVAAERVVYAEREAEKAAERESARAPQMRLRANMNGDWFPGWNGCYPPTLSALEIQWLEEGRGRRGIQAAQASMNSKTSAWARDKDMLAKAV